MVEPILGAPRLAPAPDAPLSDVKTDAQGNPIFDDQSLNEAELISLVRSLPDRFPQMWAYLVSDDQDPFGMISAYPESDAEATGALRAVLAMLARRDLSPIRIYPKMGDGKTLESYQTSELDDWIEAMNDADAKKLVDKCRKYEALPEFEAQRAAAKKERAELLAHPEFGSW